MRSGGSFILFNEQWAALSILSDEQRGKILQAFFHESGGEAPMPELDQATMGIFLLIQQRLKDNREKYEIKCAANKANGSRGGRPKNSENPKEPNGFPENPTVNPDNPEKPNGFFQNPLDTDLDPDLEEKKEEDSSLRSESSRPGSAEPDKQAGAEPPASSPASAPAKKPKQPKAPPVFAEDSEPYRLAAYMRDQLAAVLPTFHEPDAQKWAREFDIALRNDERMKDPRFVAEVIRWVAQDGFWRANCQCPATLRKQFDKLTARMAEEASRARAAPVAPAKSWQQRQEEDVWAAWEQRQNQQQSVGVGHG